MTKSLQELIERANDIDVFFGLGFYGLHHFEDCSFVDFEVLKVEDINTLLRLAGGLTLKFYAHSDYMIVRLLERYEES